MRLRAAFVSDVHLGSKGCRADQLLEFLKSVEVDYLFLVGDIVDLGSANGTVEAVGLRITTVRDGNGTVWYVRNGEILRVGNKSQGYAVAVADLPLGHNADIAQATEIAQRVAAEVAEDPEVAEHLIEAPEVVGIEKLGPEGVTFRVQARTRPGQQFGVQRVLITALSEAFEVSSFCCASRSCLAFSVRLSLPGCVGDDSIGTVSAEVAGSVGGMSSGWPPATATMKGKTASAKQQADRTAACITSLSSLIGR